MAKKFTKTDWLVLISVELIFVIFFVGVFIYNELNFSYMTQSSDFIYQHIPLIEDLRKTFWQSHELIPQFIPNLGGGQNAFNYTYHGLFNPLIIPFYFLPFLSGYYYLILIMSLTILATGGLVYYWLRQRFSCGFAACASATILFATCLCYQACANYMFISYMPWLIAALISVDRIIYKKKFLLFIISIALISLTSFVYIFSCLIIIGLYTIFVYLEKTQKAEKVKSHIKHFFILAGKIAIYALLGLGLSCLVFLPTVNVVLTNRVQTSVKYNIFDLLYPSLYFFPSTKNLYLPRYIDSATSLGVSAICLIFVSLLLFSKSRKYIFLAASFLIICIFPIFSYILGMGLYAAEKFLIPFLPIFALLFAAALKFIHSAIYSSPVSEKKQQLYKKSFFVFTASFLCLTTIIPTVRNFISNHPSADIYMSKQFTTFSKNFQNSIQETLESNNPIYRSTVSTTPRRSMECQYHSINKVLSDNYFTDSIYTSSNDPSYQNYHTNMLWQPPLCSAIFWGITNNNSLYARTLMAEKYLFLETSDTSAPTLGYQNTNPYVWENDNVFSIGYAGNNLFSNINNMTDIQQKASLIQGIALNKDSTNEDSIGENSQDKSAEKLQEPNIQNIEQLDLSDIFAKQQKGLSSFKIDANQNINYKLPKTIHNRLLFIKIKLNDKILDSKQKGDAVNALTINGNRNSLAGGTNTYNSLDTNLRYIIQPDKNQNIENLDIKNLDINISNGTWPIESIQAFTMPISDIQNAPKQFDQMNVTKFDTQGLFGNINITRPDSVIAFSLGYDPGFSLKIDGQNTPIFEVNGGIIGSFINPGFHNIELTYSAPYYNAGLTVSSITLMLVIGSVIIPKTNLYKKFIN
ncbi:MAG: YfhO family protein [Bifidobacteriaceae bacterium]|jgi:hypothetical protein|nr:YfhO family protein [Bifidobacteriaceae bacterium]